MYLRAHDNGIVIKVKVTPNSSRNILAQDYGDHLLVKLTSPPVEGKANKQLLKFIGKKLGVPPSSIKILRGHSSREKVLFISGIDEMAAAEKLK